MQDVYTHIETLGIVPVVVIDGAQDAVPLAQALCRGGLPCAEVTFRTAAAEDAIRSITEHCPDMLVGAGTVLTAEQADRAIDAGARFIVSPGLNPATVRHCQQKGVPVFPGVSTASEIELALSLGISTVKFFPAEQAGGIAAIKALSAPFADMRFLPTGGIQPDNMNAYLAHPSVIACGGSWMVKKELIAARQFDHIEKLTAEAVRTMLGFELCRIGIACTDKTEEKQAAGMFGALFGFAKPDGGAVFFGNSIELPPPPHLKKNGYIAVGVNSVMRAAAYLERTGCACRTDTAAYKNGALAAICLAQEIAGFTVQLVQK